MTNSKELEQLKKDLDLVTKTAKVLANKLEKMSNTFEQLIAAIEGKPIPEIDTTPSPAVSEAPVSQPARPAAPAAKATPPARPTTTPSIDSKAGRLIDSFLSQVPSMNKGREIAKALDHLRDQVMQSAGIGFHPAFHEMGRYASTIKNMRDISTEEKERLVEKIYDWRQRLTS